ncbi:hypothetical protein [Bacillus sp. JJ1562]|uniref:hypothetical protein n=1 Tax=Bacillus sp. JJ1562 TaxID=3122960 RepID=UPI00300268D8
MNKRIRYFFSMVFVMILALVISGCNDSKVVSNSETSDKNSEATEKDTETAENNSETIEMDTKDSETANQDIQDFVLENTKMVKIFNISQRIHQKQPDLGPFHVARGIDERGQKTEVWIKDNKIYEMINSDNSQAAASNNGEEEENTDTEEN